MAEPASTVWMVNARTGMGGRKGRISLRHATLHFEPESKSFGTTEYALADIKRVRRVIGTPVLEIALRAQGQPGRVGFYFIQPPPLGEVEQGRYFSRRRAKKNALNKLRLANADKKEEVKRWVEEIRGAMDAPGKRPEQDQSPRTET